MSFPFYLQCFSLVIALATIPGMHDAVKFIVKNEDVTAPGGWVFRYGIGNNNAREAMRLAADFIWETFRQKSDNPETILNQKKEVQTIKLIIGKEYSSPYIIHNEIHFSHIVIEECMRHPRDFLFSQMIYRWMTKILQWDDDDVPPGLREGIGYYIKLKAGYRPRGFKILPKGERWYEGNYVTAKFLIYCEKRRPQFVADLNAEIKNGYKESIFKQLLNEEVDELWKNYKAEN